MKKILILVAGVLIALFGVFYYIGANEKVLKVEPQTIKYEQVQRVADSVNKSVIEDRQSVEKRRQQNSAGGKTPEETLDMLIAVLKEGNAVKASTFFDASKEKYVYEWFVKIFKNPEAKNLLVNYFQKARDRGGKKCYENFSPPTCTIIYSYVVKPGENFSIMGYGEPIKINRYTADEELYTAGPGIKLVFNRTTMVWQIDTPSVDNLYIADALYK